MSKGTDTAIIRERLLSVAEEAFMQKSFRDVSMRELSQKSGVGLANIYNYFKGKDDIFGTLVTPAMRYIDRMLIQHNDEKYLTLDFFHNEYYIDYAVNEMERLILHYRDKLVLLFFHSKGSRFESYKRDLTEKHCQTGILYFERMKERYPNINTDFSPIIISVIAGMHVTVLEHLLMTQKITKELIYDVIRTYVRFTTAGWQRIMNIPYDEKD